MKLHRFILPFEVRNGRVEVADIEIVNQIKNVLKLKKGEQVILGDGNMHEALGEIADYKKDAVELNVVKEMKNENEPTKHVVLYCAVLKRENFEWVVQKATELGVKEIVPVITKRTVKLDIKKERLEKIIKEAAEQSGRGIVPVLHEPIDFAKAVQKADGLNILADVSGGSAPVEAFTTLKLGIWIGPEGGFDESEITMAKNAGFIIATLGKLTLRAETAAVVASYLAVGNLPAGRQD